MLKSQNNGQFLIDFIKLKLFSAFTMCSRKSILEKNVIPFSLDELCIFRYRTQIKNVSIGLTLYIRNTIRMTV